MIHDWYKHNGRYFVTTFHGFNDVICIDYHDGGITKTHWGHDVTVEGSCVKRSEIKQFLKRCKLIAQTKNGGIPPQVIEAVYKGKPVPEFRKTTELIGDQFSLLI